MSVSTAGELVYAIGDIHGCYDLFKALLARVAADSAARARGRRPILVLLGDYIDRGPQSAQVIEALVWLKRRPDFDVRLLRGNHEQALLDFLDAPEAGAPWLRFGGRQTLESYGVLPPDPADLPGLTAARDELMTVMPAAHLRLYERLELMLGVGDYAFVHAGVRPDIPLAAQDVDDLLWIRQPFLEAPGPFERIVVHGHTWLNAEVQRGAHRIGVDTGAFATGVLSAVRLDGGEVEVLQAARTTAAA